MPDPSALELLHALATVLDGRGLRWYLFGAQAVVVHGQPRLSDDVDVTVEIDWEQTRGLVDSLEAAGFEQEVVDEDGDFIEVTRVIPLRHRATGMPLDIVLAGPGIEELFLDRATVHDIGGVQIKVICPEHLIVTKILAGRDKDLADARGVILRQTGSLDADEVRDLLRALEQALAQSDLVAAFEQMLAQG